MHLQNPYCNRYDLKRLVKHYPLLQKHIVLNPSGEETIDFLSSTAVYSLNKAMLLADFKLEDYDLPMGYLIPPVPGRFLPVTFWCQWRALPRFHLPSCY